ncbi:MAG: dimethylhistidine N-methyltransferase [Rhodothermales bacterium]|jgi:dimethylhistidine N-methyltransferase
MGSRQTEVPLFIDEGLPTGSIHDDVVAGLSQSPKTLPPKLFYDEEGSRLFDAICELDEYYPTRTEIGIMRSRLGEITEAVGAGALLVEYGSGSSVKTEILLERLEEMAGYVPIDISREHLLASAKRIARRHPDLAIFPVAADYSETISGLADLTTEHRAVVYFPGSTIGNFQPPKAEDFLARAAMLVGPGGGMLIGVDLRKDPSVLEAAYDDASGVTAAFNLNMLRHINREAQADFDLTAFRHRAVWNEEASRIEMHLVSRLDQKVRLGDAVITLARDEAIVTEHSYKYTLSGFAEMAARAGFTSTRTWTDSGDMFSVHYLVARGTVAGDTVPQDNAKAD